MRSRGIDAEVAARLRNFAVVILEGGRGVGKSTTCRALAAQSGWGYVDLSEPGTREQLRIDPIRSLSDIGSGANTVVVDEAQLEPELPLWVKLVVDRAGGRPGQFLLTGSARLGRDQLGGSDPLAGRSSRLRMWPLTLSERRDAPLNVAATMFQSDDVVLHRSTASDEEQLMRGGLPGLPGVLHPAGAAESQLALGSYVEAVVPLGASPRSDHARLIRTFRYVAANSGQIFNASRAASDLAVKADTVRTQIDQLESSFLLFRTEAHRPAEHRTVTAHPRLFATDVGLAAWAAQLSRRQPNPSERGALLETLVAIELSASAHWTPDVIQVRHWRDQRARHEVDLLLAHSDGRLVPIEVKAARRVHPDDASGLVALARTHPDRFHRAVLVYLGDRVIDLSPAGMPSRSILAIPRDRLF